MHRFTAHRRNTRRYFAYIGVPVLPLCNLFGHRPRVAVQESKYSDPWLLVECAWCGRRAREDDTAMKSILGDLSREERAAKAKEIQHHRVANARRDPVAFARQQYDRRASFVNDRRLELSLEVVDRRDEVAKRGLLKTVLSHAGVSLRVGDRFSESPYHLHADVGVVGVYASAGGMFGRFAGWLGRGHKRELSLALHGGHLWWHLWYNDDGGNDAHHECDSWRQPKVWPWSAGRRKHRGWMCLRSGNLELNPADALWGRPRPKDVVLVVDVTLPVAMGDFPGDTYLITGKLQRRDWAREHGPRWARKRSSTFDFDWRCSPGIPVRNDSWKGDEVLGSGVSLTADEALGDRWQELVIERVADSMRRDRERYRYSPPAPVS